MPLPKEQSDLLEKAKKVLISLMEKEFTPDQLELYEEFAKKKQH
jgi:hypothetical protein